MTGTVEYSFVAKAYSSLAVYPGMKYCSVYYESVSRGTVTYH
jgi:hypothetical protein